MIDYKNNRLDYGELLHPPQGYELSMAVATTYSLDLFALMSIPVALFYKKNLDGEVKETRLDILNAIQKTSDAVKVYCQKGKIGVPKSYNKIVAFIEDCIAEVLPDEKHVSFHPKIWIIRYQGKDKNPVYRVIVLSRNLTFDRSWDLAFFLEGKTGNKKNIKNESLADYLEYLRKKSDFKDSDKFINDLLNTDFKIDTPFFDFNFCPSGFSNRKAPLPVNTKDLLIVSPFIQQDALNQFKKSGYGKKFLFSRKEELDKLPVHSLDDFDVYSFSHRIVEGELVEDEGALTEPLSQNLHAKLYILSDQEKSSWYLGSANCTNSGFEKNQEFLIQLISENPKASAKEIKKLLLNPSGKEEQEEYFVPYTRETKTVDQTNEIDFSEPVYMLLHAIEKEKALKASWAPNKNESKLYDIHLHIKPLKILSDKRFRISLKIYGRGELQRIDPINGNKFERISLPNLSPFVHWSIEHIDSGEKHEFITKIDIDLPEGRKDAIFQNIIENKERFFKFIRFLLGEDLEEFDPDDGKENETGDVQEKYDLENRDAAVLEELLLAASRHPSKIKDIDKIIKRLDTGDIDSPIPEDFKEFWSVFKPYGKNE